MMEAGKGNCSLGLERTLEINGRIYHWSWGSAICRCCEGGISDSIEHVILVCRLHEGERVRLFQGVGEVLGRMWGVGVKWTK